MGQIDSQLKKLDPLPLWERRMVLGCYSRIDIHRNGSSVAESFDTSPQPDCRVRRPPVSRGVSQITVLLLWSVRANLGLSFAVAAVPGLSYEPLTSLLITFLQRIDGLLRTI